MTRRQAFIRELRAKIKDARFAFVLLASLCALVPARAQQLAALSDYSAYREGDTFFVLLPHANANALQRDLAGVRGLIGARVEQRADDALISFQLAPGWAA